MRPLHRGWTALLLLLLLLLLMATARAARAGTPLLIWPIDPVIPPGQQAAALWLENHGAEPATLQVRVFGWSQDGRDEQYQPQQRLLPSPPIASIPAGGRQLVRLIATQPPAPGAEAAYRIFIDELPAPGAAEAETAGAAVRLQLRYAVPLFAYGAGTVPPLTRTRDGLGGPDRDAMQPAVQWTTRAEGGRHYLVLTNSGTAHARVTAVEATGATPQSINPGLLGYVLAGSSMRFALASPLPARAGLRAQLNGRTVDLPRAVD